MDEEQLCVQGVRADFFRRASNWIALRSAHQGDAELAAAGVVGVHEPLQRAARARSSVAEALAHAAKSLLSLGTMGIVLAVLGNDGHRESPPVTETIAEWLDKDFHSNVLMVIHSTRNPSSGKALVICEPNVVDNDDDDEEPIKIPNVRMQKMIKKVRGKMAKKSVVFINNERPETNTRRICLTLALEWMVQLIAGGKDALPIERDDSSRVTGIEGLQYISPPELYTLACVSWKTNSYCFVLLRL
ncbi:hypothetical protein B0H14DRAFT_2581958 [Mycena olivaceomarginata]|nr:hypothetical protein B0H14DRAFT_2581958 [Mycena olivaceomarginata]